MPTRGDLYGLPLSYLDNRYLSLLSVSTTSDKYTASRIVSASDTLDKSNAHYVCDGIDDQIEINNAISDLTHGGEVYIRAGNYNLSSPIVLDRSYVTLKGEGWGSVLKANPSTDINVIQSNAHHDNMTIENLCIDGNMDNQATGGNGIDVHGSTLNISHNLIVGVSGKGIYVGNPSIAGTTSYVNIIHNNFINSGCDYGIYFSNNNTDWWITKNNIGSTYANIKAENGGSTLRILDNHLNGESEYNIDLTNGTFEHLLVANNILEDAGKHAFYYKGGSNASTIYTSLQVNDNIIRNFSRELADTYSGIYIEATSPSLMVKNIDIVGNCFTRTDNNFSGKHMIEMSGVLNYTITGNSFVGVNQSLAMINTSLCSLGNIIGNTQSEHFLDQNLSLNVSSTPTIALPNMLKLFAKTNELNQDRFFSIDSNGTEVELGNKDNYVTVAASDSKNKSSAHYICDGIDDQVEINNAINAVSWFGRVNLLAGNYYLSSVVSLTQYTQLVGQGTDQQGSNLNFTSGVTTHMINIGYSAIIDNVNMYNNRASSPSCGDGVFNDQSTSWIKIKDSKIDGFTHGINVYGANHRFDNLTVTNNCIYGVRCETDSFMTNSFVGSNGATITNEYSCNLFVPGWGFQATNNHIWNSQVNARFDWCNSNMFVNNIFEESNGPAIVGFGRFNNHLIMGNSFVGGAFVGGLSSTATNGYYNFIDIQDINPNETAIDNMIIDNVFKSFPNASVPQFGYIFSECSLCDNNTFSNNKIVGNIYSNGIVNKYGSNTFISNVTGAINYIDNGINTNNVYINSLLNLSGATILGANINISDTTNNTISFGEINTPSNPDVDEIKLYAKDVGGITRLHTLDSDGTEVELGAGGSASISSLPALSDVDDSLTYTDHYLFQADGDKFISNTYSHTWLDDIGTYSHASIDSHIDIDGIAHSNATNLVHTTGDESIGGIKTFTSFPLTPSSLPTADYQVANKAYVDSYAMGLSWKVPVLDKDLSTPPVSPNDGDRYIVMATGTGDWAGHDNDIAEYVTDHWEFTDATDGDAVITLDDNNGWVWNGSAWVQFSASETYTADGEGIELSLNEFSLELDGNTLSKSASGLRLSVGNGTISQLLGMNQTGTAQEYKTLIAGSNVAIANATGSIEISSSLSGTPDYVYTTEPLHHHPSSSYTWTNLPVALTAGGTYLTKRVNLTGATQFRIVVTQAIAGYAGSKLRLRYSTNGSTYYDMDSDNSGDLDVGSGTGIKAGSWTNIVSGAKTEVWLQLYALSGDGIVDPQFRQIDLQFRYNSTIVDFSSSDTVHREITIHSHPNSSLTWTNMPLATTEFIGNAYNRQKVDLHNVTHYRLVVNQAVAGYAGADINLQYSTNGTTWQSADTAGAGELDVGTGTGVKVSAWATLVSGARDDVWIRLVGKDGNGVVDPQFRQVVVQLKEYTYGQGVTGNDTEVLFNDAGSTGADAGMTYNKTTNTLTLTGDVVVANEDYGVAWDASNEVPTKNAIYDKIQSMNSIATVVDTSTIDLTLTGDSLSADVRTDSINDTHIDWGTSANQVSAVDVPIEDAGGYITGTEVETALQELGLHKTHLVDQYMFGFVTNYDGTQQTTISFDGTNTFTLAPTSTIWSYYRNGVRHTITGSKTVTLSGTPPASKGHYYIFIDATDGTLTASTVSWTLEDTKVPVATLCWDNALTPKYILADERHTCAIDRRYHWEHHFADGTEPITIPTISGYTVTPAVPTNTDNTFAVSVGAIADEDLKHILSALSDGDGVNANYFIQYRTGASTWDWVKSIMPYRYTAGGYIQYDNGGTMTQGQASKFYNTYLLLSNQSGDSRFTFIHGQSEFANLASANAETFRSLVKTGICIDEYIAVYQFTWGTNAGYATLGKCRLAQAPVAIFSPAIGGTSGISMDHGSLTGLADDDHTQYLPVDGSRPLTADWDAGNYEIRAQTLESDVSTGTAPMTIASTTLVTNLNADKLDGADLDTTVTLGTSDDKIPSQNAVKTYVDNLLGNANALIYKGTIDCSANPDYPTANAGEMYIVSVAGRIGGVSGIVVDVGDMLICNTDSTVSGDQATVGSYWNIIEKNIIGAVSGPASSTNDNLASYDGTTGKIIKDSGMSILSVTSAVSMSHLRIHNMDSYLDHAMGSLGSGYLIKSNGTILVTSTFSDIELVGLTSNSHLKIHNLDSYLDHSMGSLVSGYLVKSNGTILVSSIFSDAQLTSIASSAHAPITLTGDNYLSLTGQQITLNKINLTSNITGTLSIPNGGTGQLTAQNAINALTQVIGATNEYVLTKDTTTGNAIWKAPSGGIGESAEYLYTLPYVTLSLDSYLTGERVLTAGEGIDITDGGANSTVTIDCEDATTTNKGIASFSTDNFAVSSGAVTIKDGGVSLTAEVTGTLPVGNGGTGRTILHAIEGLGLVWLSTTKIAVLQGKVEINGTIYTLSRTTLDVSVAGDYIGGSSLRGTSKYLYVYTDGTNIDFHEDPPLYPTCSAVFQWNAQVNGNPSASATSIAYDGSSGTLEVGDEVRIWSGNSYTQAQLRGAYTVDATFTGSTPMIVQVNGLDGADNDYLTCVRGNGQKYRYRDFSGTWYRCLGAIRLNATGSGNVTQFNMHVDTSEAFFQHTDLAVAPNILVTNPATTNSTTFTYFSMASLVPPFARKVLLFAYNDATTDVPTGVWFSYNGTGNGDVFLYSRRICGGQMIASVHPAQAGYYAAIPSSGAIGAILFSGYWWER
jgi:hypothetical protein